jgi:hypothetical protein
MELLDNDDDLKRDLLRKSAKHREEIEGEVKLITENTEKVIVNALIIGGSLALTYFLVRQLSGTSRKKTKGRRKSIKLVHAEAPAVMEGENIEEPSSLGVIGQVGGALATQASMFLLNLAKEKLVEYLKGVAEKKKSG